MSFGLILTLMIQLKTFLRVIDNSGGLVAECINSLKKSAGPGDEIVVAIKQAKPSVFKVKRGDVCRALVVRTRAGTSRPDGSHVSFGDNACVLLNRQGQPLGNRVMGVVAMETRQPRWAKVASLATQFV